MKRYKLYQSPAGLREAVKLGWSWPAFFFSFFWAFTKRLYAIGAAVLAIGIVLVLVTWNNSELARSGAYETARSVDHLADLARWAMATFLAVNGNEFREKRLQDLNYVLLGEVAARSVEEALSSSPIAI